MTAATLLADAHECQAQLDLHAALAALEQARMLEPANAAVLSFASKQWTDHTFLPGMALEDIVRCNEKAIELAKRAQAADDSFALAHCAECICKGRLATFEQMKPRRMLQLAKEAQEAAYGALARDAEDDIAHHLIGRWNRGMASLNWAQRQLVKLIFGDKYRPGTVESALTWYEEAARLRPDRLIHKVEAAHCLAALKRSEEAINLLHVRPSSLRSQCHARACELSVPIFAPPGVSLKVDSRRRLLHGSSTCSSLLLFIATSCIEHGHVRR